MEEPQHLVLSDNLLYAVFRCSSVRYRYMFPHTSRERQSHFDAFLGGYVSNIWRNSWYRTIFFAGQSPMYWRLSEEAFGRNAESLRGLFTSPEQCFVLMVHVALLAAFFARAGRPRARFWAFRIISRYARECDLEIQNFNRRRPVVVNLDLQY